MELIFARLLAQMHVKILQIYIDILTDNLRCYNNIYSLNQDEVFRHISDM